MSFASKFTSQIQQAFLDELHNIFKINGTLQNKIANYRYRDEQWKLVQEIAHTMIEGSTLLAQAGTGTGKTYAYLVPALLSKGKVIISTASKTLQDQLFNKDLPNMLAVLGIPAQVSLLKGRNNYLCKHYLQEVKTYHQFETQQEIKWFKHIERFGQTTKTGDKSECSNVPENASIWNWVTATKDTCLGSKCEYHADCFMMQARKQALMADVVVVNHHLFIADLMLKENDIELLPKSNLVIFDEAHHLPSIATHFFGSNVTTNQITHLCQDVNMIGVVHCPDVKWGNVCNNLDKTAKDARLMLQVGKYQLQDLEHNAEFISITQNLAKQLQDFCTLLAQHMQRHVEIEKLYQRAQELLDNLNLWLKVQADYVYWVSVAQQSLQWHVTPLNIAHKFSAHQQQTWIFTSATMAVNQKFDHFINELGISGDRQICLASPFDYQKNLMYIPHQIVDVSHRDFAHQFIQSIWPILLSSAGHALILCTTLRALNEYAEKLQHILKQHDLAWPLLVQGQDTRAKLLHLFKTTSNAILIGSQSFWEGVDVPGQALRVVAIDKIPFAVPDDPIHAAKIRYFKQQNKSAFMDYQLPLASITLQQGVGRLIRNEGDTGVLVIGDNRIVHKAYGQILLNSLPNFNISYDINDACKFF
jgi:ATP-dependent DNA helicase DinG